MDYYLIFFLEHFYIVYTIKYKAKELVKLGVKNFKFQNFVTNETLFKIEFLCLYS